jgi:hypothetical protein
VLWWSGALTRFFQAAPPSRCLRAIRLTSIGRASRQRRSIPAGRCPSGAKDEVHFEPFPAMVGRTVRNRGSVQVDLPLHVGGVAFLSRNVRANVATMPDRTVRRWHKNMRKAVIIFGLALLGAITALPSGSHAQPWCAVGGPRGMDCDFSTREQCTTEGRWRGVGARCVRNPSLLPKAQLATRRSGISHRPAIAGRARRRN